MNREVRSERRKIIKLFRKSKNWCQYYTKCYKEYFPFILEHFQLKF